MLPSANSNDLPASIWSVRLWLVLSCSLVFLMVIIGGLTRLTHSGLSMVEWAPLHVLPPLDDTEWTQAFTLYQTSPEYHLVNPDMDLAGYKTIFWLEYVHRLVGRLTGLIFTAPLLYFALRRSLSQTLIKRLFVLLILGCLQGLIGWLMVASGLVDQPQVSPYRLAAHLSMALMIYSVLVWTALDLLPPTKPHPLSRTLRRVAWVPLSLVGLTVIWGAFVAGLHAGLVSDTFPLMEGHLFPSSGLEMHPLMLNFVENLSTVQFTHRLLAVSTVAVLTVLWALSRHPLLVLPTLWAWVQASLGVSTILFHVPVPLAALHQTGAVILLTLLLRMVHQMRF